MILRERGQRLELCVTRRREDHVQDEQGDEHAVAECLSVADSCLVIARGRQLHLRHAEEEHREEEVGRRIEQEEDGEGGRVGRRGAR